MTPYAVGERFMWGPAGPIVTILTVSDDGQFLTIKIPQGALANPSWPLIREVTRADLVQLDYHDALSEAGYRHDSRSCPVCQQQ